MILKMNDQQIYPELYTNLIGAEHAVGGESSAKGDRKHRAEQVNKL